MSRTSLPVGKLPAPLLASVLARAPVGDPRIVLGPGVGLDCAVVEAGAGLLVLKSDPITFVAEDIGRYLVQINANDIATTGAVPRWLLVTLLLPAGATTPTLVDVIMDDIYAACRGLDISVVGGHTEITHGLTQPIAVGTLIGEVGRDRLITPKGARPGDRVLLTKSVPIEGTSLLAREFGPRLRALLNEEELQRARNYLVEPGVSVVADARIALQAGHVTAMHDPTEGGLLAALWELAEASGRTLVVDPQAVPVSTLAARICAFFDIDPLATIASGALLLTAPPPDAARICTALAARGIPCTDIGEVAEGPPIVERRTRTGRERLDWPARDGVAQVLDRSGPDS